MESRIIANARSVRLSDRQAVRAAVDKVRRRGRSPTNCSKRHVDRRERAESQGGQTKPDFIAKLAIARKESWETIYWLQLAIATSITTKDEVAWELDEAQQLKAMITAAIKTGQSSDVARSHHDD